MDKLPKRIRKMHVIDGIFVGDKRALHLLDTLSELGISHALVFPQIFAASPFIRSDSPFFDFNLPIQRGNIRIQIDDPTMRIADNQYATPPQNYNDHKARVEAIFDEVLYLDIHRDARMPDDALSSGIDFVCKHIKAAKKVIILTDNVVYATPMIFIFGYLLDKGYPLPELVRAMVAKVNVPRLYRHNWQQLLAHFNLSYTYEDIQKWVLEGWEERGAGV